MAAGDPLARNAAIALGAARAGLGASILAFTDRTIEGMGFEGVDDTAHALGKLLGGRDLAIGLAVIAAGGDAEKLRRLTAMATIVDAADAIALSLAARDRRGARRGALGGAAFAGAATIAGAWVCSRLARD